MPGRIVPQVGAAIRVIPRPGAQLVDGRDPPVQSTVEEEVLAIPAEVSPVTARASEG
jgi:hypothetical protein